MNAEFSLNLVDEQDSTLLLHHRSSTLCLSLSLSSARSTDRVPSVFCDHSDLSFFFLLLRDRPHCVIDSLTVHTSEGVCSGMVLPRWRSLSCTRQKIFSTWSFMEAVPMIASTAWDSTIRYDTRHMEFLSRMVRCNIASILSAWAL